MTTLTMSDIETLNLLSRELLDKYYASNGRDGDSFFKIDKILRICIEHHLTTDEVPTLLEMKNVIVMG